ncbi:ribosomal protein L11 methyltransferase [Thiovulum sp. ES]|nr:ribosomal protein L11 methyltransferase [Thiovulum sp. ES]
MSERKYYELVVTPLSHYDLFLDFILQISEIGLEEFEDKIILRSSDPFDDTVWGIQQFQKKISEHFQTEIGVEISVEEKENRDWIESFKQSVQPVEIQNFYIYPSWHQPKEGFSNILIDPALAFGSGHHETTALCVKAISENNLENKTVLDVGTGSGILSIVSAKIGAIVDLCDVDEVAVESAKDNFAKNDLTFRNSWVGSAGNTENKYDFVIANIIPDIIIAISNDLKNRVAENGKLLLSGILHNRVDFVLQNFKEFKLVKREDKNEWVSLLLERL